MAAPLGGTSASDASASDASAAVPMFGDVFTDIHAHYLLGRKLGTGNFAKVVQGTCRHDLPQCRLKAGEHVAVKVVKKPQSRSAVERLHMIRAEVEILRSVQHANIVRLCMPHRARTPSEQTSRATTGDPHATALQCIQTGLLLTRLIPALDS